MCKNYLSFLIIFVICANTITAQTSRFNKVSSFPLQKGIAQNYVMSPNGKWIVSNSYKQNIQIMAVRDMSIQSNIEITNHSINNLLFNADGSLLLGVKDDKYISVWSVKDSFKFINDIPLMGSLGVKRIIMSSNSKYIAWIENKSDQIIVWSIDNQNSIKLPIEHTGAINDICFSLDNKYIVSGGIDMSIVIWDTQRWEKIKTIRSQKKGAVLSLAFSPDGKNLLVTGEDKTILLWDTKKWKIRALSDLYADDVKYIYYSPGGVYFITLESNGTIKFWDSKGLFIFYEIKNETPLVNVAFTPGGFYLSGLDTLGVMCFWTIIDKKGSIKKKLFKPIEQRYIELLYDSL